MTSKTKRIRHGRTWYSRKRKASSINTRREVQRSLLCNNKETRRTWFPYNAIDINNPEEIEAAVEKHTRIDPKERALANPLEAEREEEDLVDDPDNETDERTPTDIAENGSEEDEPFEDTNDKGDWDDVEGTDKSDSRDTNLSPPMKENDLGDKRDKQATDPK